MHNKELIVAIEKTFNNMKDQSKSAILALFENVGYIYSPSGGIHQASNVIIMIKKDKDTKKLIVHYRAKRTEEFVLDAKTISKTLSWLRHNKICPTIQQFSTPKAYTDSFEPRYVGKITLCL